MKDQKTKPEVWVSKADGAKKAEISVRQLNRYVGDGRVRQQGKKEEAVVSLDDLMHLQKGTPAIPGWVRSIPDSSRALPPPAVPPVEPVAPPPPPPTHTWLTIKEAVAYSRLPRGFIMRSIASGLVSAINVGSENTPKWKVWRESLDRDLSKSSA
jgi:hypothetical protein